MATKATKMEYTEAVGRRKTSIARVRLSTSTKTAITINDRTLENYFTSDAFRTVAKEPLATAEAGNYAVSVHVRGGGMSSQSAAVAHGIARALVKAHTELKAPIKKAGLLTRDARIKERRKFGLKKARKAPQWSKR